MKQITNGQWKRDGEAIQVEWHKIPEYPNGTEIEFDGVTCKVVDHGGRFRSGPYAYGYLYVTKVVGEASQPAAPKGGERIPSAYDQIMYRQAQERAYDDAMDRGEQWPMIQEEAIGSPEGGAL